MRILAEHPEEIDEWIPGIVFEYILEEFGKDLGGNSCEKIGRTCERVFR